jgi:DNA-binding CsgD family transcriptional regulator
MLNDSNQFSEREKDVVKLLLRGKSNKQIALDLGISTRTVEFHLSNIYAKLNVSSRTEVILKLAKGRLWESTGNSASDLLVNSTVDQIPGSTKNGFKSILWRSPVKKRYYHFGGLFVIILIAAMVIFNLPAPNSGSPKVIATNVSSTITSTAAVQISTEVASTPPVAVQPTNIVIPPHTVNGYTAAIESYHADISHIMFQVRVTGGDISFGDEHFYDRIGSQDIYDEYGNLINSSSGFGPAIEDPTLIQMGFEPVTHLIGNHLKGQLVFKINNAPAYNETLAQFSFDFDLPIYSEARFSPKQVITANGLEILLDSVTVTPTYMQVYLCFQQPTFAPWTMSGDSILQIGEQKATPHSSRLLFNSDVGGDKRGTSEPYWVPPVKNGTCMKYGFRIDSANPTSLTLTIPNLEDAWAGAPLFTTNQLAINYPGMSPKQAYSKYLEENGNVYKGPWVFTVELKP